MNSLSLMFYFAGVVGSFAVFLWFSTILCLVALVGYNIHVASYNEENRMFSSYEDREDKKPFAAWHFFTLFLVGLFLSLIPSQETIYLVAASEVGERVATSDYGQEVLDGLKEILDNKLASFKNED